MSEVLKTKCPKCGGDLTMAYKNFRKCKKCGLIPKERHYKENK